MKRRAAVGILIGSKGRGSNMVALVRAMQSGQVPGEPVLVIAPTHQTQGEKSAKELGVPVQVIAPGEDYGERLVEALKPCDIVCLAGFTRLLPLDVVRAFQDRILNIHPALLPKFGGKGMYGRHVHEAVLASRESVSGCSVHFVTEAYDEGAVIHQRTCPVLPEDTAETLAARVLAQEHLAYPEALAKVIVGLD